MPPRSLHHRSQAVAARKRPLILSRDREGAVNSPERGQALLLATVSLVAMFGLLGLVVDVGWGYFRQQAAQAAAEAAALAAMEAAVVNGGGSFACESHGVACHVETCPAVAPNPPVNNLHNGCLYAAANGFPATARSAVTMSAGSGPAAPAVPGVPVRYWTSAAVSETLPQLFSAVLRHRFLTTGARATAGVFINGENACLYVLDPAAPGAFTAHGTTEINATGCDVYVNSSSAMALSVTGGAILRAGSVQLVGGYEKVGATSVIDPNPVTRVSTEPDPFADLPAPPSGPCKERNWSISGQDTAALQPGVYCGGITVGGHAKVTLGSGTYVLNGGGLSVGADASLSGNGVLIFNTGSGGTAAGIKLAGGGSVSLTASNAGTYKGILFYQDRTLTAPPGSDLTGGGGMHLNGTVYIPNAGVKFAGGSTSDFTALVVRSVVYTGNSFFKPDPTGEHTGLMRRTVALIE